MGTSKLQEYTGQLLREAFHDFDVQENRRPAWLITDRGGRLELDFWIDDLWAAIEVQGIQHVQYTPHFHASEKAFYEQKRRDDEKAEGCRENGLQLFYVFCEQDAEHVIKEIRATRDQFKNENESKERPSIIGLRPRRKPIMTDQEKLDQRIFSFRKFLKDHQFAGQKHRLKKKHRDRLSIYLLRIEKSIHNENVILNEQDQELLDSVRRLMSAPKRKRKEQNAQERKRYMQVKAFEGHLFLVWGGENQHVVWMKDFDDPDGHICDCRGWYAAKDKICRHIRSVHGVTRSK